MRCSYCGTDNDEGSTRCRKCGEELSDARARWTGPAGKPATRTAEQVSSASSAWDPAQRYTGRRSMSAFVPPPKYPTHRSWIVTIMLVGIPATLIHIILFYRGVTYPNHLEIAVEVVLFCCLPLSVVALMFSWLVSIKNRASKEKHAYRYSRTTGLLCWISLMAALALYVILFMRLIYAVGEFWVY